MTYQLLTSALTVRWIQAGRLVQRRFHALTIEDSESRMMIGKIAFHRPEESLLTNTSLIGETREIITDLMTDAHDVAKAENVTIHQEDELMRAGHLHANPSMMRHAITMAHVRDTRVEDMIQITLGAEVVVVVGEDVVADIKLTMSLYLVLEENHVRIREDMTRAEMAVSEEMPFSCQNHRHILNWMSERFVCYCCVYAYLSLHSSDQQ